MRTLIMALGVTLAAACGSSDDDDSNNQSSGGSTGNGTGGSNSNSSNSNSSSNATTTSPGGSGGVTNSTGNAGGTTSDAGGATSDAGGTTSDAGGTTSDAGGSGGTSTGGTSTGGTSSDSGGTSGANGGASGSGGAESCPASPPADGTSCNSSSCFYQDCADFGRVVAECADGTWSVETGPCDDFGCSTAGACEDDELCLVEASGTLRRCVPNTCGSSSIACDCVDECEASCAPDISGSVESGIQLACTLVNG